MILLAWILSFFSFCSASTNAGRPTPGGESVGVPSHDIWNQLLKKYVSADGKVNYKGFIKDQAALDQYLNLLSTHPPDEQKWSQNEQKAYWINAYNAFTVKLITKYYPVKSIKDIGSSIQIPFVNTPWDIKFFKIGADKMDLNNIEHGKLRRKFHDPRVHFAIVCASKSCPILRNEAYEPGRLDQQLDDQGRRFLADHFRNKVTPDQLQLSKIFSWYHGDFTRNGSFIDFINKYAPVKVKEDASISYMDYNWALNEQ